MAEPTRGQKSAATRLGISIEEYVGHLAAGEKWCFICKAWHPHDQFRPDQSSRTGLSDRCRAVSWRQTTPPQITDEITKHSDVRLLRDIEAQRVWADDRSAIWREERKSPVAAPSRYRADPAVRAVRRNGWSIAGADGIEVLTGDGRAALAAWDATHDTAVGAVTVR